MKWFPIAAAGLCAACGSEMLTSPEEEFLGSWIAEFSQADGTTVRIVWTFRYLESTRKAWNEVRKVESTERREGTWEVLDSKQLRVVLESQFIQVTDRYEDGPHDEEEADLGSVVGAVVGALIGELLLSLTNDEYIIDYVRDGDVLRLKWYGDEYHSYVRNDG